MKAFSRTIVRFVSLEMSSDRYADPLYGHDLCSLDALLSQMPSSSDPVPFEILEIEGTG